MMRLRFAPSPTGYLHIGSARTFVFTTGLPPANVASALAALEVIEGDPGLAARPLARAQRFTAALGLPRAESA